MQTNPKGDIECRFRPLSAWKSRVIARYVSRSAPVPLSEECKARLMDLVYPASKGSLRKRKITEYSRKVLQIVTDSRRPIDANGVFVEMTRKNCSHCGPKFQRLLATQWGGMIRGSLQALVSLGYVARTAKTIDGKQVDHYSVTRTGKGMLAIFAEEAERQNLRGHAGVFVRRAPTLHALFGIVRQYADVELFFHNIRASVTDGLKSAATRIHLVSRIRIVVRTVLLPRPRV
jgi:hypothetical protein